MKTLVYNLRNTTAQVTDAQSTLTLFDATRSAANCANRGTARVHPTAELLLLQGCS